MKKSIFFYKELTPAEVGKTGTHEIYVRLPNNFDYETFFGDTAVENGSVLEVNFNATDTTDNCDSIVSLRFVYFKNSNKEKRIPSLGELFRNHNVQEGDVVCIERREDDAKASYYIHFYRNGEIIINPNSVFFMRIGDEKINKLTSSNITHSLQQIFYGAPGTGKSHRIKDDANVKAADEKNLVFRTTFHPDSDYSTFVGAYKPTMRSVADKYKAVAGKDEEITYSFVPQAFLQAYVAAWNNPDDKVFLVIEEINRGNCAQIFGDLFQLLDRDCDGCSEYPIMADKDLAKYLKGKDENGQDILTNKDGIKDGKLRLPKNLFIWATMNTSDQSLFPIDSAFKRRWEWVYMPIDTEKEKWYVEINGNHYSWTEFLNTINDDILTDETAEDKHLGFYFCKATKKKEPSDINPNVIMAETFVGKVLFYLWNDVFKVYGIPTNIGTSKDWAYRKFYRPDGTVDQDKVAELMGKLKIQSEEEGQTANED